MAVFVVSATARNQDVIWSFCDLDSSRAIALKLEWTPIKPYCSKPVMLQIFTIEFPNMQISPILDIARNEHKIARMLENAVLNVFGVVLRLRTLFITSDGGVYRLRFLGCRGFQK